MKAGTKSTSKLNQFGITKICLSPDKKMMACGIKDSNSVEIYQIGSFAAPNTWQLMYTLKEHTQRVSALAWSNQNQLITGSYDRNVIVWSLSVQENKWLPSLVVLQQNKNAILDVSWDKAGRKFAIGTGGHKLFIAQYEQNNKWWMGEKCSEKLHSSLLSVAMHPCGMIAAVGCADQQFCIVTCYQNDFDKDIKVEGKFADVKTFGEKIFQKENLGGWVNSVAFSQSGNSFAFAVHNQDLYAGQIIDSKQFSVVQVKYDQLPFTSLSFINDSQFVATGFDYYPHLFEFSKDLKFIKTIKKNQYQTAQQGQIKKESKVQSMIKEQEKQLDENLNEHTTQILGCELVQSQGTPVIVTNDINGKVFFWNIQ